jgi:hypothetical protein
MDKPEHTSTQEDGAEKKSPLNGLEGVYLGFHPTDESAIQYGEFELTITPDKLTLRMATGLKVDVEEKAIQDLALTEMSAEEKAEQFPDIKDPSEIRCFALDGKPWLIIQSDYESDTPVVLNGGELAEIVGPTILFTPRQVEKGHFDKMIKIYETDFGTEGVIPRLSCDGIAPVDQD